VKKGIFFGNIDISLEGEYVERRKGKKRNLRRNFERKFFEDRGDF